MGRQFAIGDIHGCAATFRKLVMENLQFSKDDILYLLGDYVNKGPDSRGVFDFVFSLKESGHQVVCLKGNHEAYLLDAVEDPGCQEYFLERGGIATLKSFGVSEAGKIPSKYLDFMNDLPLYLELDDCFLVHAGFDFSLSDPFSDEFSMIHIRKMQVDLNRTGGRYVIHGHVPTTVADIISSVNSREAHISIDAGCVYAHIYSLSHLAALNLGSMQLFLEKNIDVQI